MTIAELFDQLIEQGYGNLVLRLRQVKTETGFYLFAHDDPANGPFAGDGDELRFNTLWGNRELV